MLNLDPAKLMVVLVVGLIVLGPDKLPKLARQLGAAWGDLRRLRQRLEDEVRGAFPEMPSTHEVARAVRSPIALLDRLADAHEREKTQASTDGASGAMTNGTITKPAGPVANGSSASTSLQGAPGGNGASPDASPGASPDAESLPEGRAWISREGSPDVSVLGGTSPALADDPSMN